MALIRLSTRNAIGREFSYAGTVDAPTIINARMAYAVANGLPVSDVKGELAPEKVTKKIAKAEAKKHWQRLPREGVNKLRLTFSLLLESIEDYTLLEIEEALRGKHGAETLRKLVDKEIETRQKGNKR